MQDTKIPVIAINREYGAGGNALAEILSDRLGIPYYDRDFVTKTVEESGYEKEEVEREGEELSVSSRMIDNLLSGTVSYSSSHDKIFEAEKKVILELAKEPCIIIGRCADHILREAGIDSVSIYLHGPLEKRLQRLRELTENDDVRLDKFIEKRDSQRNTFYKQYTGREISDASNYTVSFDIGRVRIPLCADIVMNILGKGNDPAGRTGEN